MPAFKPKPWVKPVLYLLLLFYWLILARYIERVYLINTPPGWWLTAIQRFPSLDTLTNFVTFSAQFISLRVLRHLIPVIIGWQIIRYSTVILLQNLYDLPDRENAGNLLNRLLTGSGPLIILRADTLLQDRQQYSDLRIGGPARVFVSSSDVVVTEYNGHFRRVLGPGIHNLVPFERIYAILDLQAHEQENAHVPLITQDGIPMTTSLSITYCLNSGGNLPTTNQPYPFSEEAVRDAAYAQAVLPKSISDWHGLPLTQAVNQLQKAVANRNLDDLIASDPPSADPHADLVREIRQGAGQRLRGYGIEILSVRLGSLEPPEAITTQRIDNWRAPLENHRLTDLAEGQIDSLREIELARANARVDMLKAIANGIRQAQNEADYDYRQYITALRLIDALESMARQSLAGDIGPEESMPDVMRQLRELRWQLQSRQDEGQ
ncbi:MAG: SPFH domain-containing protein [Anaerolineales bacterium]|nr:SPFH domain-containing protein [Anaerolineales bacterium]MCB8953846.1 SPFH domain-containing protein [Ardenticatenales bacterium]